MDFIQECIATARRVDAGVVLPEGDDERIVQAARRLRDESIARPILLGNRAAIEARAGERLDGIDLIDPDDGERIDHYVAAYTAARPKVKPGAAARQLRKPLFYGGMMVRCGDAGAMVAGVANPTQRVIKAASLTIGTAEGIDTPSSFFVMVPGAAGRPRVFADCAVAIDPDERALADIALASAESARRILGVEPQVAILESASAFDLTPDSDRRVQRAAEIVAERAPGLAANALPAADAGEANVLVFPDLNAGNIGYKMTQYLGGQRAIGPFLQGFARPVSDLSRGATVDDIVACVAVMLAGTISAR